MLSDNTPEPSIKGPVLMIAQIIKNVMSFTAEDELSGLFICAKAVILLRNTLIEMGWLQPPSPVQCNNSTATGVTNKTMVNKMLKSMDMRLWWLQYRHSQEHFRYYWSPGKQNLADYSTNHHPPLYHLSHRPTHKGYKIHATAHCKGVLLIVAQEHYRLEQVRYRELKHYT